MNKKNEKRIERLEDNIERLESLVIEVATTINGFQSIREELSDLRVSLENIFTKAKVKENIVPVKTFGCALSKISGESMMNSLKSIVGDPFNIKIALGQTITHYPFNNRKNKALEISLLNVKNSLTLFIEQKSYPRNTSCHTFEWKMDDLLQTGQKVNLTKNEMLNAIKQRKVTIKFNITSKTDNGKYIPNFDYGTYITIGK